MLCFFFLISYIILVLAATLFPFELVINSPVTLAGIFSAVEWDLISRFALKDFPRNVALFIPFGFCLAYLMRRWKSSLFHKGMIVLAAGTLLSLSIEILQQFIPFRFSAFADILANAAGALMGLAGCFFWENQALKKVNQSINQWLLFIPTRWLVILALIYILLLPIGLAGLQRGSLLDNWDNTFPLLLGNERTGDRPWQGMISEFYFTNQAFNPDQITQSFQENGPVAVTEDSFLVGYNFSGAESFSNSPRPFALVWKNEPAAFETGEGIVIDSSRWLESSAPAKDLADTVKQTSQFTLSLILASHDSTQTGPARIFSLSADPYHRNLTLGQEQDDLIIRLRNGTTGENATHPEIIIPGLFLDESKQHIILTYDGKTLKVYTNAVQNLDQFSFTPEVNLFWRFALLTLPQISGIQAGSASLFILKLLFGGLIVFPLIFLLLFYLSKNRRPLSPVEQQR